MYSIFIKADYSHVKKTIIASLKPETPNMEINDYGDSTHIWDPDAKIYYWIYKYRSHTRIDTNEPDIEVTISELIEKYGWNNVRWLTKPSQ